MDCFVASLVELRRTSRRCRLSFTPEQRKSGAGVYNFATTAWDSEEASANTNALQENDAAVASAMQFIGGLGDHTSLITRARQLICDG